MIRTIEKKYLSCGDNTQEGRRRAGLAAGIAGIALNLTLFAVKCAAGAISGSIAITADGFNNLADTGACLTVVLGLRLGARRPCRKYPFGCGRIEYLSGLLIAAAVIALGVRMMLSSAARIIRPEPIGGKPAVIGMLLFSIAVKGYMYRLNKRIGALIDSAGMKAAATDALSDCIATSAIIAALLIGNLTGLNIDGYTGALVALCILWAGIAAARDSLGPLLGRGVSDEMERTIRRIALRHPDITGIYGVALHDYGPQKKLLTLTVSLTGGAEQTLLDLQEEIRRELNADVIVGIGEESSSKGTEDLSVE